MKTITLYSLLALFLIISTGCATLFGPSKHTVAVSSEPSGADVYVNGFKMGQTPTELSLKADKSYTIEYRKDGYQNVARVINTKVGAGWLVLDILGGLLPVVIDAATGNWNSFDQDAVNAVLEPR